MYLFNATWTETFHPYALIFNEELKKNLGKSVTLTLSKL